MGNSFLSFTVEAGETINLGTMQMETVELEYKRDGLLRAAGALALDFNKNQDVTFVVYESVDNSSKLSSNIEVEFQELAQRAVTKPLKSIIPRDDLEMAYRKAYAVREDGTAPSRSEARQNLRNELRSMRLSILKNLLEQNREKSAEEVISE